jgi:hypothetical protein
LTGGCSWRSGVGRLRKCENSSAERLKWGVVEGEVAAQKKQGWGPDKRGYRVQARASRDLRQFAFSLVSFLDFFFAISSMRSPLTFHIHIIRSKWILSITLNPHNQQFQLI